MSPKLAFKILFILIVVTLFTVLSFYIANKFFLNMFNNNYNSKSVNIKEMKDIEVIEYTEEERAEKAENKIREVEKVLIKNDLKEKGVITSTTARTIEDMINDEIRKQKEAKENKK